MHMAQCQEYHIHAPRMLSLLSHANIRMHTYTHTSTHTLTYEMCPFPLSEEVKLLH